VHSLGTYLRLVGDESLDAMGSYKLELARLFPDLASRLGAAASAAVDPETDRARLFDAVDALVAEIASGHPLLVVLDDLHWADQPSLALLRWVLRSDRGGSVLFVATYRDTDVDRRHPLGGLLADFRRDGSVTRVALAGLDQDGMTELLVDRAGHEVPPEFARRLHEETDGNPYFAGEVLAHLAETGAIYQRDGTWVSDVAARDLGCPRACVTSSAGVCPSLRCRQRSSRGRGRGRTRLRRADRCGGRTDGSGRRARGARGPG